MSWLERLVTWVLILLAGICAMEANVQLSHRIAVLEQMHDEGRP